MLALSVPRSAGLALLQREHGARGTMALSIPRLLRGARRMYGRRSLRGFVLGSGDDVSPPVGARSSAGVYPTTRLLRWWWERRGRSSHLRSLLLRWHVDEDVDVARANTRSGSHNLDAPYLARQRCRGNEHLWGRGSFRSCWDRWPYEDRIEARHARDFTQLRSSPER